jgi:hypothetical protein
LRNRWAEDFSIHESIKTFFERGDLDYGKFISLMKAEEFSEPIFGDRASIVALQSADLFAWEQHYELRRLRDSNRVNAESPRQIIQMLLDIPFESAGESYHGEFKKSDLEGFITGAGIPSRI